MVRALAAGGCVAVLCACTSSIAVTPPTPSPSNSAAETPAASLRVHVDLLLGEHVFVIAKLAVAAAAGRQDEYHSYAGMLAANDVDVESLLRTALGETAGGQFGDAWTELDNELVDYLVAVVTHDKASADAAAARLTSTFGPDLIAVLKTSVAMPDDVATRLVTSHITALKSLVDLTAAGDAALYKALAGAQMTAVALGDAIVARIATAFPDRFPGDATVQGAQFRAQLAAAVQLQSYVMTMATNAAIRGTAADSAAAATALSNTSSYLATLHGGTVWAIEAGLVVSYAKKPDSSARQSVLDSATADHLDAAFAAILQVADDQRLKAYNNLATDDRAAASAFAAAADEIATNPSPSS